MLKKPGSGAKLRSIPISKDDVELVRVAGSRQRGGGVNGDAWIIMAQGKRAGTAYINMLEDEVRGPHASFHIFLNRPSQGRHIGRAAYRLGCEAAVRHSEIYAHMRKSNTASRLAAIHAGFVDATAPTDTQLVLRWSRSANNCSALTQSQLSDIKVT